MSGGSQGDRYYTQGAPTRTGARGMRGSLTSPRGYHGAQPPLGVGARLLGSPGRNTGSSLVQQRAALPKPDGNLCSYSSYECNKERLTGYEFCLRHILCDKNAPYKPCGYCGDSQSGLKCSRPAPCFNRGDSYCAQHTRVILAARQRSSKKRKSTPNILLESLVSYKKSKVDNKTPADESAPLLPALNPFQQRFDPEAEGLGLAALESEGLQVESEDMLIRDTYTGGVDGESEGESVDSEGEDSLQLAGVYTVEEVMRILKDKLVKLQKLYIDQFQRLVFKMKESRREYLIQLKEEKEAGLVNISDQPNKDLEYERLKAMMHYFCPSGREALLSNKHRDKRLLHSGSSSKQTSFCQHTLTTTTKCNGVCVPMAKFCQKHILEEQGQVLYRACGVVTPADGPCETPVASLFAHTTCVYHAKIPVFNQSENTDGEESNDKPSEPTEDNASVQSVTKEDISVPPVDKEETSNVQPVTKEDTSDQPVNKEETASVPPETKKEAVNDQPVTKVDTASPVTKEDFVSNKTSNNVSSNAINDNQKLKQETGLDTFKPDVNDSNVDKPSEVLMKVEESESNLQSCSSIDTSIKEEVDSEEVIEKMDVDLIDEIKSEVSSNRIIKKESESEQKYIKKDDIEKGVDNEKNMKQTLDLSENKIVGNQESSHNKTTDIGQENKSNSKDIKGKEDTMFNKEFDEKHHEMDIEKEEVPKSNDNLASKGEAKVLDKLSEKSEKESDKKKDDEEIEENILKVSSIEEKEKSIEGKDGVTEITEEVQQKSDDAGLNSDKDSLQVSEVSNKADEVTEKLEDVTEKSKDLTEKLEKEKDNFYEVTEKTDELKEKIDEKQDKVKDELDEVAQKTDEVAQKTEKVAKETDEVAEIKDEVANKTDEVAEKTVEVADKTNVVAEKTNVVAKKTDGVAKKTDEVAKKTEEVAEKTDEVAEKTDEVAEKTDEVAEIPDEVAKKIDEAAKKTDKVAENIYELAEKTDDVAEKTDKVAEKTYEVADTTDEVAEKTYEVADTTNEVAEKTDEVAKKTEDVEEHKTGLEAKK